MKRQLSLTLRLTVFFAVTSGIVLLGLAWIITLSIEEHFITQDKDVLEKKSKIVQDIILQIDDSMTFQDLPNILKSNLIGHNDLIISAISTDSSTLYSSSDIEIPFHELFKKTDSKLNRVISWSYGDQNYRSLITSVSTESRPKTSFYLMISINTIHHDTFMYRFQGSLLSYTVIATLISGMLGLFAARKGLLPLYKMKDQALSITVNQLSRRMPDKSVPVEISTLAKALNKMLDNLEDSFRRLSNFSSDIAHELRTPISNLSTQTQVALSKPRDAETYRNVLISNAEEHEHISRMITDMLFLAKTDNGLIPPSSETIPLDEQVNDLFEFYDALAEDKRISLILKGRGSITGDRLMVRRAINNLLSNAIRHTPKEGTITVNIIERNDCITLTVCNTGSPIPKSEIPHLFDRFYRAEQSRTKNDSDGFGLGLAITEAILKTHAGTISVTSDEYQTCFIMDYPINTVSTGSLRH